MSSKINRMLQKWPTRTVATLHWLSSESEDLRIHPMNGTGLHALQTQLGLGGRRVILFGKPGIKLPSWLFMRHQWLQAVVLVTGGIFDKLNAPSPGL